MKWHLGSEECNKWHNADFHRFELNFSKKVLFLRILILN